MKKEPRNDALLLQCKDAKEICLTDIDGAVFVGEVLEVIFPQEKSDLEENEFSIVLRIGAQEIEFLQSEIKSISVISKL